MSSLTRAPDTPPASVENSTKGSIRRVLIMRRIVHIQTMFEQRLEHLHQIPAAAA